MNSLTVFLINALFCIVAYSKKCTILESGTDNGAALAIHNYYRRKLLDNKVPGQPLPRFWISELKWDEFLAGEALKVALTCNYLKYQRVNDSRFAVGQSFAWYPYKGKVDKNAIEINWNQTVTDLFDNYKTYKYPNVRLTFDKANRYPLIIPSNPYTQMIWPTTEFVGCGYAIFHEEDEDTTVKFAVCSYGPLGTIIAPYEASYYSDYKKSKS